MIMQEKFAAVLLARGEQEVPSRSQKYRVFTRTGHTNMFYFLGRNGAVRVGATISASIPISNNAKWMVLEEWSMLQPAYQVLP